MNVIGIYCWTNKLNGKKYVGVSGNIYKRWNQHIQLSKSGKQRVFYDAIRKYGECNFNKEILEIFEDYNKEHLKEREDYYIDFYNTLKEGYNVEKGYNSITNHPDIDEIKKKISNKAKRRRWINNGELQKTIDIDTLKNHIDNGWVLGRLKFTQEHIENLSKSHIGHSPTKETRKKLSKLWKGRNHSEKTKNKMSKDLKGRYSLDWYIKKYGEKIGKIKHFNHHQKSIEYNKNKICVNNGEINRMIPKNELSLYLEKRWNKGRIKK